MQTIESVYQADTRLLSTELWEYVSKGLTDQRVLIKWVWPKYNQIPRHHHVTSWLLWFAKWSLVGLFYYSFEMRLASMGGPLLDLYISSFCIEKGLAPPPKKARETQLNFNQLASWDFLHASSSRIGVLETLPKSPSWKKVQWNNSRHARNSSNVFPDQQAYQKKASETLLPSLKLEGLPPTRSVWVWKSLKSDIPTHISRSSRNMS